MKLKPDLHVSVASAQSIIDQAGSDRAVATVSRLHGGEIAAVYEIAFIDQAHPSTRPEGLIRMILHWKMQKGVTVSQF